MNPFKVIAAIFRYAGVYVIILVGILVLGLVSWLAFRIHYTVGSLVSSTGTILIGGALGAMLRTYSPLYASQLPAPKTGRKSLSALLSYGVPVLAGLTVVSVLYHVTFALLSLKAGKH